MLIYLEINILFLLLLHKLIKEYGKQYGNQLERWNYN